jgi:hypothetical protein
MREGGGQEEGGEEERGGAIEEKGGGGNLFTNQILLINCHGKLLSVYLA